MLGFVIPSFSQPPTGNVRRVALVVGNGACEVNPLRTPPNDAEDVAEALKDAGFEVIMEGCRPGLL